MNWKLGELDLLTHKDIALSLPDFSGTAHVRKCGGSSVPEVVFGGQSTKKTRNSEDTRSNAYAPVPMVSHRSSEQSSRC